MLVDSAAASNVIVITLAVAADVATIVGLPSTSNVISQGPAIASSPIDVRVAWLYPAGILFTVIPISAPAFLKFIGALCALDLISDAIGAPPIPSST